MYEPPCSCGWWELVRWVNSTQLKSPWSAELWWWRWALDDQSGGAALSRQTILLVHQVWKQGLNFNGIHLKICRLNFTLLTPRWVRTSRDEKGGRHVLIGQYLWRGVEVRSWGKSEGGEECSQGRKFDDDHDYDGWRPGDARLLQIRLHGVWAAAVSFPAELPVHVRSALPTALPALRLAPAPPARQRQPLQRHQLLQPLTSLPVREPRAPQPLLAVLPQQHGGPDAVRRRR